MQEYQLLLEKKSKSDMSVEDLRCVVRTSSDRAWNYEHRPSSLKPLGLAIGLQDMITVYVIRRETGNMMNSRNNSNKTGTNFSDYHHESNIGSIGAYRSWCKQVSIHSIGISYRRTLDQTFESYIKDKQRIRLCGVQHRRMFVWTRGCLINCHRNNGHH